MKSSCTEKIPTAAECREMMERYAMLPNIVLHSYQVMNVALVIADHLKDGLSINRDLVTAGALLHDITKTRALKTKERHDASGGALLRELGFPAVAEIIEQHVRIPKLDLQEDVDETEIVYYADKRVMHDAIVTVEERLRDLIARYGVDEEARRRILQNGKQVLDVERKIAGFMKMDIHLAVGQAAAKNGAQAGRPDGLTR